MYVCMYLCMYVCMYVCVCVYIYIYICIPSGPELLNSSLPCRAWVPVLALELRDGWGTL